MHERCLINYNYVGAGAYAGSAYCVHRGKYSEILQKMVYPGNRCFLQESDGLRLDEDNFPVKKVEKSSPPQMKTMES